MKYLFVGGSRDGQELEFDARRAVIFIPRDYTHGSEIEYDAYYPLPFRGENTEYTIYAIQGTTPDELIAALIKHYNPKQNREALIERLAEVIDHAIRKSLISAYSDVQRIIEHTFNS